MANLYDKAGLVNIPVGYQNGFLYNIKPEDNILGFRFNRDSAATRVNKEGLIEQVGYFGPELVKNGNFSELGPELVVNGNFATDSNWSKLNATISGGKGNLDGNGQTSLLYQNILTQNKSYKATFTVSNYNGLGQARIINSNGDTYYTITQNGTFTVYFKHIFSDGLFYFRAISGAVYSIDNVSVKQVDPNNYWSLGTGWSFGNNKATYDGSAYSSIEQSISNLNNKKIKVQFDIIDYTSGTIRILPNDRQDGADVRFSGNGTYTQIYTSISNKIGLQPQLFNGSITNISIVEILGDKPRIDYTDSLTSPSFLLEPQSTNLLTFSEDFSQSVWQKTDVSITSGFLAPDGSTNAYKIEKTGSANTGIVYGFSGQNTNKTKSIWAKTVSGTGKVTLLNNNTDTNALFDITEEWQRFDITHNSADFFYAVDFRNASATLTEVLIWGAQLEALSYATSYIPTAGSTVTRAQETCNGAGSESTFNSTEGVLYAEIAALANDQTNRRITISDSTNANRVVMGYNTTSNEIFYFVVVNNSTVASGSYASSDITQFSKIAIKFAANNFALWVDGIERHTDISGAIFSQDTLTSLQFEQGAGNSLFFYGKTKGVYVFNEALTDDELQQLTGPEYNSFAALAAAYNYTVI